jgi:biotin-dependent carboxylase-like uncharacterized protein
MRGLKILQGGFLTTIQDGGRFGYRQFGMPRAGAMDDFAFRVGNLLVGNHESTAVLEITVTGPEIEFCGDTVFAITGAPLPPLLDGQTILMWQSCLAENGQVLSFGALGAGCRAYVAVAGGIDVPVVMGSRSTYLRAAVGGFHGRKLHKGDFVPLWPLTPAAVRAVGQYYNGGLPDIPAASYCG